MPRPPHSQFHRVWGIQTGSTPLFIWQPIPPSPEFVAMGMVATKSEETPSVRSVHCVPLAWVDAAPEMVKMLWSDSGAGGKAGSLWSVGSLQLLAASPGQKPPTETAYKLKSTRFTLGEIGMRTAGRQAPSTSGSEYNRHRGSSEVPAVTLMGLPSFTPAPPGGLPPSSSFKAPASSRGHTVSTDIGSVASSTPREGIGTTGFSSRSGKGDGISRGGLQNTSL